MHIKHLDTGTGSAKAAMMYLLQDHDHKGEKRSDVQVLRGNPEFVTHLADSLNFKHKYSSAVIAWHKEDKPTLEQVEEAVHEYERVSFAGLVQNQYARYVVMHDMDHVHIITARVELSTRKSFNVAPPGHEKTYDLIRDKLNEKYGWARPDDLGRKRLVNDSINIHADLKVNEAKKMVNDSVKELAIAGTLQNRDDVVKYLAQFGEITRKGKNYISLKPKGFKKAFKLQGAVYERDYELKRLVEETRAEHKERAARSKADREREVARIESVIQGVVRDRAEFNRSRYGEASQQSQKASKQDQTRDLQRTERGLKGDQGRSSEPTPSREQNQSSLLDNTLDGRLNSYDRTRDRTMGIGSNHIRPQPNAPRSEHTNSRSSTKQKESRSVQSSKQDIQEWDRGEEGLHDQELARKRQRAMVRRDSEERAINDAIRKRIKAKLEATRRDVFQRATERIEGIREEYRTNQDSIRKADTRSLESDRTAGQDVGAIREHIKQLANQFRRTATERVRRSSEEVGESCGQFSGVIQSFSRWIGELGEKIIAKAKEIVKKRASSQSNSLWMKR